MTPDFLYWLAPAVQIAAPVYISSRVTSWRTHPGLVAWLLTGASINVYALAGGYPYAPAIVSGQMVVWAGAVVEIARFSRLGSRWGRAAFLASSVACAAARLLLETHRDRQILRSYYLLAVAAVAGGMAAYRLLRPLSTPNVVTIARQPHAESRRHKAYRLGFAAWATVASAVGSFVPGGLGYAILPYTPYRRSLIDLAAWIGVPLVLAVMAVAMRGRFGVRRAAEQTGDGWIRPAAERAA